MKDKIIIIITLGSRIFRWRNGETGRTYKKADKRKIWTAMGNKRNAKDRTNGE